ncbi:MAG: hypothetical protein IKC69_02360 [Clostridia bacterium]|nr:hypothetical protein [Clostridia bacterium]
MKEKAIVYSSQTGFTARYATLLGEMLSLPVYSLKEAKGQLAKKESVIYFGWLMGGLVRGLAPARKRFSVSAVCAVGMGEAGSQLESVRQMNRLEESIPLYTLQGGYREEALPAVYRWVMQPVKKSLISSLSAKENRSEGEERSLRMLREGGDCVERDALLPIAKAFLQ